MSLINEDELNATFRLELLPGEIHNETNIVYPGVFCLTLLINTNIFLFHI